MKKNAIYFLVLVALISIAYFLMNRNDGSTIKKQIRDFAIADTASIDKIFMAKRTGGSILLEKEVSGKWNLNGKYPARFDAVEQILMAMKRVAVHSPVPKSSMHSVMKNLATDAIKVEFYSKGKLDKTIYVGTSTKDFTGTYMLIEGSEVPFITHIPGWEGYLTVRFFLNEQEWRDRAILTLNPTEIQSVKLDYADDKSKNFEMVNNLGTFNIVGEEAKSDPKKCAMYASFFSKFSIEGFENDNIKKDSTLNLQPITTLIVTMKNGKKHTLKVFDKSIELPEDAVDHDFEGLKDQDRKYLYYVENKDFVLIQEFGAGKFFRKKTDFYKN